MTDPLSLTIDTETNQQFAAQFAHIQSQLDATQRSRLGHVLRYLMNDRTLDEARLHISGKTVRQLLDTYGDDAVVWVERRRNLWADVRSQFLRGTIHEVQSITCPKCAGALHVKFDVNSTQPDGSVAGYMNIMCTSCNAGSCADGLIETPPWVEHGTKIVTNPKS